MGKDLWRLKPLQLTALSIEQCFMWLRAFMLMQGNEQAVVAKENDKMRWSRHGRCEMEKGRRWKAMK